MTKPTVQLQAENKQLRAQIREYQKIIRDHAEGSDDRYAELDAAAVESMPVGTSKNLDWLVKGSGWKLGDGPIPGVFVDKAKGNRCLWSCKWSTSIGLLAPDNFMVVEHMTTAQLRAEILDVIYRTGGGGWGHKEHKLLQMYLDYHEHPAPVHVRNVMMKDLRQIRIGYPDYIFPAAPPPANLLKMARFRPGWPDEGKVTEDAPPLPREKVISQLWRDAVSR